ncbi:MAG: hypothetical protein V3T23_02845 [Nitrososphaerales archaeon]
MDVEIKQLGLAAYVKINGGKIRGYQNGKFIMDTDKSEQEWEIEYMNSESFKHDSEVMYLRKLMR